MWRVAEPRRHMRLMAILEYLRGSIAHDEGAKVGSNARGFTGLANAPAPGYELMSSCVISRSLSPVIAPVHVRMMVPLRWTKTVVGIPSTL